MKKFFAILALVALANVNLATLSIGGENKKQPLQMEEKVELAKQEAKDHPEVRYITAGVTSGYGIVQLAAMVGAGYLAYDQFTDDD
jgi:hypothetical protein